MRNVHEFAVETGRIDLDYSLLFFCVTREICFYFSSDCSYNFRPFGVIAVIMRTKQKVRAKEYVYEDGLLLPQNK